MPGERFQAPLKWLNTELQELRLLTEFRYFRLAFCLFVCLFIYALSSLAYNVRRPLLWRTLLERGFPQTIVNIMKSAYDDIERKVFWKGTVTEPIKNNKGLKQGSSLSGLKFNHYIAAVSAYLDAACEGVSIGRRKISHLIIILS